MRAATVVDSGNSLEAVVVATELGDGGRSTLFVVLGEDREDGYFGVSNGGGARGGGGGGLNGSDGENDGEKGQGDGVERGEGGHFCVYGCVEGE